jgi:hypothetical protein
MNASQTLEELAEELLETEWQCPGPGVKGRRAGREAVATLEPHSLHWLVHDLVELAAQTHGRPIADLAPMIRQRIADQHFIDETGDSVVAENIEEQVDRQVQAVIRVLEQVRQAALRRGEWSEAPVVPEMFG